MEKHEWRVKSAPGGDDLEKLLAAFEEDGFDVVSVFAHDKHLWVVGRKGLPAKKKPLLFR